MKISYPAGSIECIAAADSLGDIALWCGHVTYVLTKLDMSTNPTTVMCKALGVGPAPSRFATPVKGTIVYDLDGLEPSDSHHSNFLTFKSTTKGVDVEIVWEISSEMFERAFSDNEQNALCYRRTPEEIEEMGMSGRNPNYDPGSRD